MIRAVRAQAALSMSVAMLGVALTAQTAPRVVVRDAAATARAVQWVEAAVQHAPGVDDRAIEDIVGWNAADLTGVAVEIHVIRQLMRDPRGRVFVMPGAYQRYPATARIHERAD